MHFIYICNPSLNPEFRIHRFYSVSSPRAPGKFILENMRVKPSLAGLKYKSF